MRPFAVEKRDGRWFIRDTAAGYLDQHRYVEGPFATRELAEANCAALIFMRMLDEQMIDDPDPTSCP